jgi:hypothetical protein
VFPKASVWLYALRNALVQILESGS